MTEVESGQAIGGLTVEEIERQQRALIRVPEAPSTEGDSAASPSTKDLLTMIAAAAGPGGVLPAMPQVRVNDPCHFKAEGIKNKDFS